MATFVIEWFVYVRWQSGQRQTIRCTAPDQLSNRSDLWVVACLPVPTVTVVHRR
jgi:hypothetical protein